MKFGGGWKSRTSLPGAWCFELFFGVSVGAGTSRSSLWWADPTNYPTVTKQRGNNFHLTVVTPAKHGELRGGARREGRVMEMT